MKINDNNDGSTLGRDHSSTTTLTEHAPANGVLQSRQNEAPLDANAALVRDASEEISPGPGLFCMAPFLTLIQPLARPEAPLVQTLKETGPGGDISYDDDLGAATGILRSDVEGIVEEVTPDYVNIKTVLGYVVRDVHSPSSTSRADATQTPVVRVGDRVARGDLLVKSDYTDEHGTFAPGVNGRIALAPWIVEGARDSVIISEAFARRLAGTHVYERHLEYGPEIKRGTAHYTCMFPHKFNDDQLMKLDDDGVVWPGQIVQTGDPIILATRPKRGSPDPQAALWSSHLRDVRADAALTWAGPVPGKVVNVKKRKNSVVVRIKATEPAKAGDSLICGRRGRSRSICRVIADAHMVCTNDGRTIDLLLNPLGLPPGAKEALLYEMLLGKVAAKTGRPIKLSASALAADFWETTVKRFLDAVGEQTDEGIHQPGIESPCAITVLVGVATVMKLSPLPTEIIPAWM